MKKVLFAMILMVTTTALAFGGGNHNRTHQWYKQGVDAIGVHMNGKGQADIIPCDLSPDDCASGQIMETECACAASECPVGETQNTDGTCSNNTCTDNSNCSTTQYCNVVGTYNDGICSFGSGICSNLGNSNSYGEYTWSTSETMPRDAANNWCKAKLGNTHGLANTTFLESLNNTEISTIRAALGEEIEGEFWTNKIEDNTCAVKVVSIHLEDNFYHISHTGIRDLDNHFPLCQ